MSQQRQLAAMRERAERAEADNAALRQECDVLYRLARLNGCSAMDIKNTVDAAAALGKKITAAMREGKNK